MPSQREVAAYAPDGTEVTWKTAGKWDVVGLVKSTDGTWHMVRQGSSWDSVRARTLTYYRRMNSYVNWDVVQVWEATAPAVREYFGSHRVSVTSVFKPETGWVSHGCHASRAQLRALAKEGVTAVAITCRGNGRCADFQMDELLKSMRVRRAAK